MPRAPSSPLPSPPTSRRRGRSTRLTSLQAPQSARRKDSGEGRRHAESDERPDPEKHSAGVGDPGADKPRPPHVEDEDAQPEDSPEQHDDVPPSPFREHQRSV